MDLYSINYIHFGAPKQWYVIQPRYQKRFESFMQGMFSLKFSVTYSFHFIVATFYTQYKSCHEFLRHKTFIVSPKVLENNNIPVQRCVQQPGEFIVTYPFGYHSGYNLDFNCAESVNFAMDSWLEIGQKAKSCACTEDSVVIDMDSLLQDIKEEHGKTRKKRKIDSKGMEKEAPAMCILCSTPASPQSSLLKSACGKYSNIHRLCAEAVDETYIIDNQVHGIDRIPMSRWKLVIHTNQFNAFY
jgi:hypothetical protein